MKRIGITADVSGDTVNLWVDVPSDLTDDEIENEIRIVLAGAEARLPRQRYDDQTLLETLAHRHGWERNYDDEDYGPERTGPKRAS